jgi:predicted membrane protein
MELWGEAANIWIQQMADNVTNEASRIEDLFRYNGIMYAGLFIILLGGVLFALLTKSSWMWYIPITAGGGLLTLIFIVQAVLYIKWIFLTALIVLVGIFVFKTWQYKKREIVALLKLEEKK